MPLGSVYGSEAGGSPVFTEVLGMKTMARWFDDLKVRRYDLHERTND